MAARKRSSKNKSSGEKWIQSAIKNPGALREQAKREGAVTKKGTIEKDWLQEKAKQGSSTVARRARLALILGKMRKGK